MAAGCRRTPYDARLFARPERSTVGLYAAHNYTVDFKDLIGRGLRDLEIDVRGRRVFLNFAVKDPAKRSLILETVRALAGGRRAPVISEINRGVAVLRRE